MKAGWWVVPFLAGCTPIQPVSTVLPVPLEPVLPVVMATELECLSDTTYEKLVLREARLKGHITRLTTIIETHNERQEN